ncbi:MAG: hypothetical protein ACRDOJ_04140 [Nocardioidaceae bacterium]
MITRDWLEGWVAAVAQDAENAHVGRFTDLTVRLLDDHGGDVVLHYDHGRVDVVDGPPAEEDPAAGAELVLEGPASAWAELIDPDAVPRRHDLLSLTKAADGIGVVSGREHLLRHLRVLTRLVEIGRRSG